ncbi:MAG: nucleotidyltransferase family protein [Desulforhopalus sp.]|nr:nucleotidyltransferase family protein [Desulforhopalus sp.]
MRSPLLELCARATGHQEQYKLLHDQCQLCKDWEAVVLRAEKEGMTPLLSKHLAESQASYPEHIRILLDFLDKRYKHHTAVRLQVLQEVLEIWAEEQLTPLLIKGAALCHTAYADPALRPMRDMDILFAPNEAVRAQRLLQSLAFVPSTAAIPADHHHLPALLKTVQGIVICIEIHHGMYPNCPPYYPEVNFDKLLATSRKLTIGTTGALTLGDMETLDYIYQHAFRPPLAYESFKLISVADLVSLTEKNLGNLDWPRIRQKYPLVYNAIPLMHHVVPWDFTKVPRDFVPQRDHRRRLAPRPFTGWPNRKLREMRAEGLGYGRVLFHTFMPSLWWFRVFYGVMTWSRLLVVILITHPRQVFWWIRLYCQFLPLGDRQSRDQPVPAYPLVRRLAMWAMNISKYFKN